MELTLQERMELLAGLSASDLKALGEMALSGAKSAVDAERNGIKNELTKLASQYRALHPQSFIRIVVGEKESKVTLEWRLDNHAPDVTFAKVKEITPPSAKKPEKVECVPDTYGYVHMPDFNAMTEAEKAVVTSNVAAGFYLNAYKTALSANK